MQSAINKYRHILVRSGIVLLLGAVVLYGYTIIPPPDETLVLDFDDLNLLLPGGSSGLPASRTLTVSWPRWLRPDGRAQVRLRFDPGPPTQLPDVRATHTVWLVAQEVGGEVHLSPPAEQVQLLPRNQAVTMAWRARLPAEGALHTRLLVVLRFVPHDADAGVVERPLWARELIIERGSGANGLALALLRGLALLGGLLGLGILGMVFVAQSAVKSSA